MKRKDGRAFDELRSVKVTRNYLSHAEGSVFFELGNTKVVCTASVEAKVPSFLRGSGQGWVTAEYSMLPRATAVRTVREVSQGRVCGRTHEIQRLIGRSLRSVTDLSALGGENTIWLDCDVVCADGGTRTAAITGAFIALYDALQFLLREGKISELPISEFVAATSVGIIEGQICLDLDFDEDSRADVDMNVVMDGKGKFIEIQGTAERDSFTWDELDLLLKLAQKGVTGLIDIQKSLLLNK